MQGYINIEKYNSKVEAYEKLQREKKTLEIEVERLKFQVEEFKRMIFGTKSERFISNTPPPEQLNLFHTPEEQKNQPPPEEKTITVPEHKRSVKKKQPKRTVLPQHLERKETIIEPDSLSEDMVKIGEERSEQLVYEPPKIYVEVTVRPKYALPTEQQTDETSPILIAPMPPRFIERSIAHPSLLARIIVDKFVDHLPLYRTINRIYRLCKLRLSKSTLSGWVKQSAQQLELLYQLLIAHVLAQDYLMIDETRIDILPNGPPPKNKGKKQRSKRKNKAIKRKTERCWFWVYHCPLTKVTFFDYEPSRGTPNPARHLKNYTGTIQTDGLEVYDKISKVFADIDHYYCLVHGRRKFEAALGNDRPRAEHALLVFQQIYAIEQQAKDEEWTVEQVQIAREQHARPLLEKFYEWLEEAALQVLPSSPIGQAIGYMLKRKAGMLYYLKDGKLQPDTNAVERAIRPLAVGRKNYLFAGSHDAAQWAAIFYSFFACCKAHKVEPYEWLCDVMLRLPKHSIQQLDQLLPHNWTPAPVTPEV